MNGRKSPLGRFVVGWLCFVLVIVISPVATATAAPVSQIDWTKVQATEVTATLSPDIGITLDGRKLDLLNVNSAEVAPLSYNNSVFVPVRVDLETICTFLGVTHKS